MNRGSMRIWAVGGGLALLALAGGCAPSAPTASGPAVVRPGAPGAPTRVQTAADLPTSSPAWTEDDVAFMRGMIAHHQQALEMTALVPGRTDREDIALLANRIELSQDVEIRLMRSWLEQRGQSTAPAMAMAHGGAMPNGMLTPEEMQQLAAASGDEFARLFLSLMIRHHQGAVEMVNALFASPGGGQESGVFQFATGVASDQPIEIARMRRMLAALGR